jgi:putative nucleotidyltransferase with HDIG domain
VQRRARALVHLFTRFFTSLFARAPNDAHVAHVARVLTPAELELWQSMSRPDRAESMATLDRLPTETAANPVWAAAALLHDVGKTRSGLGTFGRVFATLRGTLGDPARAGGRAGAYLRHAEIGAEALQQAGARAEVVAWARAHHDRARWPTDLIPASVCAALARADGEADDF